MAMESTKDSYNIDVVNSELVLEKKGTAQVNFDDGVIFDIQGSQPRHLQFFCKTDSEGNSESCDVRLSKQAREESGSFVQWKDEETN